MSSSAGFRGRFRDHSGGILLATFLLAAVIWAHEATYLDFEIQDIFYNHTAQSWVVPKSAKVPRFIFYHGPKLLLIAFGVWTLTSLVVPRNWLRHARWLSSRPRRELLYLLICLGLFPAAIGGLKKATGLHCPSELVRYDGDHEFRKLFSSRPANPDDFGHCFPAGHASGGFALFALYHFSLTRHGRRIALVVAMTAGWAMGLYQMLVGAHFLTHTLVTMLLGWLFATIAAVLLKVPSGGQSSGRNFALSETKHQLTPPLHRR